MIKMVFKTVSKTRQYYREKRIEILRDIINIVITILTLSTTKIEKIPLDNLKKLKIELQKELIRVTNS